MTRPDPLRLPLDLDLFEGPLDLLLTLVLRDEVDLAELPVAGVVNASLGGPEPWDPATAGELIVLMAALVDLKSRRLVGDDEDDLEPDPDAAEVRELLYQRLVAYAPFQKAAAWLAEADRVAGRVHYRRAPLDGPRSNRVVTSPHWASCTFLRPHDLNWSAAQRLAFSTRLDPVSLGPISTARCVS